MKKLKPSKPFHKQTLRLKDNHSWKAPSGYKIVVLDRGAVSFNIPQSWIVAKTEPHFELNDNPPPKDDARVSVSFWWMQSGVDWSGLPLIPLLTKALKGSERNILEHGKIVKSPRTDIELVWTQQRFLDMVEPREAYSRFLMARGWDVHTLITCDFWVDDLKRLDPIWHEIVHSLQLGRVIEDPTKGVTLH